MVYIYPTLTHFKKKLQWVAKSIDLKFFLSLVYQSVFEFFVGNLQKALTNSLRGTDLLKIPPLFPQSTENHPYLLVQS